MTNRHSIVTVAGRNKLAAKIATEENIVLTEIALGDGDRYPSGGETALENEIHRGVITNTGVEPGEPNAVWFDLYVAANVDTFQVQEIGLFDEDGVLYALSRFESPVPKFGPDSASLSDNTFRIVVVFSDTENVVVNVSPVAGVTPDNLPDHLPWATDAEAEDPDTINKIIQIKKLYELFGSGRDVASVAEVVAGQDNEKVLTPQNAAAHYQPMRSDYAGSNEGLIDYIAVPKCAYDNIVEATPTGAICIDFPASIGQLDTMVSMTITVSNNSPAWLCEYRLKFRVKGDADDIRNVEVVAGNPAHGETVRFSYEAATHKVRIYIGELNTARSWPQVYVTNLGLANAGAEHAGWMEGFKISVEDSFVGVIDEVIDTGTNSFEYGDIGTVINVFHTTSPASFTGNHAAFQDFLPPPNQGEAGQTWTRVSQTAITYTQIHPTGGHVTAYNAVAAYASVYERTA